MPTNSRIRPLVTGSGALCAVFVALLAGCGDDSGGGESPPPVDAGADQTAEASPAVDGSPADSTLPDAVVAEASPSEGSAPDATQSDGAASDAGSSEAGAIDTGAGDSSHGDGSSDGSLQDGHQADTSTSDGEVSDGQADATAENDAAEGPDVVDAGVCSTTTALLGSGAPSDSGPAPRVLFDFDALESADASPADVTANWQAFSDANSTATLGTTSTDGHPCVGALTMAVTYTAFAPKDQAYYSYSSAQDWTGYTTLHAWLKVVTSDYGTIQGVEPQVQSHGYADKLYGGFLSGSTFAGGAWHETVVPLSGTYDALTVNAIQFELQTTGTTVDGGGPPPATLLIDSIWLE